MPSDLTSWCAENVALRTGPKAPPPTTVDRDDLPQGPFCVLPPRTHVAQLLQSVHSRHTLLRASAATSIETDDL